VGSKLFGSLGGLASIKEKNTVRTISAKEETAYTHSFDMSHFCIIHRGQQGD